MSSRMFQGVVLQMKDSIDRTVGVIDADGIVVACSELTCIGEHRSGAVIREAPPVDVPQLIYEVRRIGNSLNQLLRIANSLGLLDAPQLRRELEVYIVDTYTKD